MAVHRFGFIFVEKIVIQAVIINPCSYSSRKRKDDGCKVQNVKICRAELRIGKSYSNFKHKYFWGEIGILITLKDKY